MASIRGAIFAGSAIAVIGATLCTETQASEQAGSEQRTDLEEVIVTATKRETRAQDTPIPLTVLNEAMLQQTNTSNVAELGTQTPSLVFSNDNSDWKVSIRGVGSDNIAVTSKQGVALHQDGVYMARPSSFGASLYDIERIEVLRGPQGTLYGRNATGGAINVISNPPNYQLGAGADVLGGSYDRMRVRGFGNVPLIADQLAFRLTASTEERDGYQDNRFPGGTEGDDADNLYVRGQLLWDISERASVIARASHYESSGVGYVRNRAAGPGFTPSVADPRDAYKDTPEHSRIKQNLYAIETGVEMGWAKATLLVNYADFDSDVRQDGDASPIPATLPGGESSAFRFVQSGDQSSAELRLNSMSSGPFSWLVGAFYYEEEIDEDFDVSLRQRLIPPFLAESTLAATSVTTVKNTSEAAFLDLSYDVLDSLTVRAGARYTRDEVEGSFIEDQGGVRPPFCFAFPLGTPCIEHTEQFPQKSWSKETWKLGLDWRVADDHLLYVTASTGFRSGGFNVSQSDPNQQFYDPENLLAYELGSKNTFADGRLRLNVSAFYYDYEDQQIQQLINFAELTENSESEIYGAELEFAFQPSRQLSFDAHASYLHGRHTDFQSGDPARPGGPDGNRLTADLFDLSGNDLALTPEFSGHVGVTYTLPVAGGADLVFRGQVYAQTKAYLRSFNLVPYDVQGSYSKSDAQITYDSNEHWYISAGIDNIENEDVIAGIEVSPSGAFQANYRAPQTWYVMAGLKF